MYTVSTRQTYSTSLDENAIWQEIFIVLNLVQIITPGLAVLLINETGLYNT